jgi:hypothetical protein
MKTILLIFSFSLPLFYPFNCSRDIVLNCPGIQYDFSDLAGNYQADHIYITSWCESDTVNNHLTIIDSLDYFMQLNVDGTGKIFGPDTLTKFDWIVQNISSTTGKHSGGCNSEFWIWTDREKIIYLSVRADELGINYYLNDSSWNFADCHREKWYYFKRAD